VTVIVKCHGALIFWVKQPMKSLTRLFDPKDTGTMIFQNVSNYLPVNTV